MNNNTNYEFTQVSTANIYTDKLYQRELNPAKVVQIVNNFDPNLVNPVKVSYRDGKYWVFDGQHTIAALKQLNHGKDLKVECKVYYGLTWLDEAHLFLEQTGKATKVEQNAKFRTLFNMGDPAVTAMVKYAEKAGYTIDFSKSSGPNRIICLSTLFKIYNSRTPQQYEEVLRIIKAAWGSDKDSVSNQILSGVALFCKTYTGQYNTNTLIKKLSRVSPAMIIREGKISTSGGATKYARQILNAYNRNASTNRLPDLL